ncbi:NAD(P)-dependent alcohol dehydrogenase [Nocardia jinanensis]|uniref:alcohol dehydrogenase n=1 Tax=Nocardia jinanensis TaxID=382504 RepID=A0A917VKL9_9NOCA|nr:NAD(P)-dependent alcohol dehydrogenase [Nocardia jinanensis]GGK90989.1 oxidoreductase [Nocardia jinanensis]
MLAVQLTAWGSEPELREIPTPRPCGEELLVRVEAAGLCRSDLHVMDSAAGGFDYPLPLTLGHEVAGTVIDAGPFADRGWIGESVVVHGIWSCGACRNCARGRENYCLRLRSDGRGVPIGNGLGHPGGLAQAMIVPAGRFLVRTRGVDPVVCAPLADAGLTAYHAVREHRDLIDSGGVCLVVGVGGLGHLAVQILREFGAGRIIAVDNRPDARTQARRLGADAVFPDIGSATGDLGEGADLIVDFAGAPDTVGPAGSALAPGGRLVVVGSAGGRLEVGKDVGLAMGWGVTAPFWGPRSDLVAVVELARRGVLHVTAQTFPLTEAVEVYRRLRAGGITGRAVLVPPA